ncbi:hypothetical protein J1605_010569 [Eschrichtius robustus]|uniref:Uncharacterized protein n=1 Tax=Eschrichtius robustus TaxID=9764 RepID=A0AB34GRA7_ESCRO|nr:hypothetical protein J1605_010569 [Eschrichtius robustus]
MPLTPCDAAGSSYIKKKEPKYLRVWVGLAAVEFVTHQPQGPTRRAQPRPARQQPAAAQPAQPSPQPGQSSPAARAMNTEMYQTPMEVAVYQLHNFNISFFSSLLGGDVVSVKLDNSILGRGGGRGRREVGGVTSALGSAVGASLRPLRRKNELLQPGAEAEGQWAWAGLGRGSGRAPCAAGEQAGSCRAEEEFLASFGAR